MVLGVTTSHRVMMEAMWPSEMLVSYCITAQHYNPENCGLSLHCHHLACEKWNSNAVSVCHCQLTAKFTFIFKVV